MIAVLRLITWGSSEWLHRDNVRLNVPVTISGPGIGYLPVYETREEAAKDYPEGPFVTVRFEEEGMSELTNP